MKPVFTITILGIIVARFRRFDVPSVHPPQYMFKRFFSGEIMIPENHVRNFGFLGGVMAEKGGEEAAVSFQEDCRTLEDSATATGDRDDFVACFITLIVDHVRLRDLDYFRMDQITYLESIGTGSDEGGKESVSGNIFDILNSSVLLENRNMHERSWSC
ncbi:hypothetical protein SUNI508_00666 [Seiridium unicorne]|uniref:Uncharacterized protein n=1 Tax=Seiridium unicorne TaxID=138068 RepID=A0ABR2V858_9PEZI